MATVTKQFHIGDVLSITSGKLVSPRGIEGVYDILGFMTNSQLWTHQLPTAAETCRPYLLRQYPWLADIDVSEVNKDTFKAWLKKGAYLDVEQNPMDDQRETNPFKDIPEGKEVIVVSPEDVRP